VDKARAARNGSRFSALYDLGDTSAHGGDESSSDLALMNDLAFWTGCDPGRMERLFSHSALGQRGKWRDRHDYRERTIKAAIAGCTDTYKPKGKPSNNGKPPASTAEVARMFCNFRCETDEKGQTVRNAKNVADLIADLREQADGWPKRVRETLFVQTSDYRPVYLESPTQLFGWIDGVSRVCWAEGPSMVSQARFYEYFRKFSGEPFDAIETCLHLPPMPATFYRHPANTSSTSGTLLERLLDFFKPASQLDRELIRAGILTLFWGGPPGSRPAFRIDGPENDPGRGTGKTTFVELLSTLNSLS
jgi:hypothetical protein